MFGLAFEDRAPASPPAPNRMDIAAFAGFVRPRRGADPHALLETFETFQQEFVFPQGSPVETAVRSFFEQGGRSCYIIPARSLNELIPGYPAALRIDPMDRRSWTGIAHLLGLPEVTYLSLPDLATHFAPPAAVPPLQTPPRTLPEGFVECIGTVLPSPPPFRRYLDPALLPAYPQEAWEQWTRAVQFVAAFVETHRRDMQFVASMPQPPEGRPIAFPANSRFVQLAWPWLQTSSSFQRPGGVEPPEGVLTGLLARNALQRGAFHSAARQPLARVFAVHPVPFSAQLEPLSKRLALFAPEPSGIQLLSDSTTSTDPLLHAAGVHRLFATLLRAARRAGEEVVFENNGEALWARLSEQMNSLLGALYRLGALRGRTAAEAFTVRCGRSTMSQNDLDNGRLIAEIAIQPAAPIEKITVVLALAPGGQLDLVVPQPPVKETAA